MNFEAVIGLEIHVEMKTKSKMFSRAPVTFGALPNTSVLPLDMAFPGTMPVVNKQAVINAIRVCNALHMEIDREIWFDRKNYFYSDLPKGFQITQAKRPIGSNGWLDIEVDGVTKHVDIERLHMEEDTCMQHHLFDSTLLDYNRAGIPLIEIVTRPTIRSGAEAMKYVERIRSIVTFADVSDGKMEEGSLRCDVNISLRPYGVTKLGTKCEIKNLNSIAAIEKAIEFEIKRQAQLLLSGQPVEQETRRYEEVKKETVLMRKKTDDVDYKYFVEPNLVPIKLSEKFIHDAITSCPELADSKKARYIQDYGLSDYDASIILLDKEVAAYFDCCVKLSPLNKLLTNWITVDIAGYLNKTGKTIKEFSVAPEHLATLVAMIDKGQISNKQARQIFEAMIEQHGEPRALADKLGMMQISDESVILGYIKEALDANPQSIEDYKAGKDRAVGFLVGQIMKKTGGKINPGLTSKLLLEELKKR